jgi:CBS domain-containing protein
MIATSLPEFAPTASAVMNPNVTTIAEDTPLPAAAQLFCQRQIDEAAVVDAEGRCVGILPVSDLMDAAVSWCEGAEDVPPARCPYQVRGRLLTGVDAVICTRSQGSCPLQELLPMTGGRHTAVCRMRDELVNPWQPVYGGVPPCTVRHYMTADPPTVGAEAPLSVLARALFEAHARKLIVVDEQHRPVGTLSDQDVLAALARPVPSSHQEEVCKP